MATRTENEPRSVDLMSVRITRNRYTQYVCVEAFTKGHATNPHRETVSGSFPGAFGGAKTFPTTVLPSSLERSPGAVKRI